MLPARQDHLISNPVRPASLGNGPVGDYVAAIQKDLAQRIAMSEVSDIDFTNFPYQPDIFERAVTEISRWSGIGFITAAAGLMIWMTLPIFGS
jgi:hypothetical protein